MKSSRTWMHAPRFKVTLRVTAIVLLLAVGAWWIVSHHNRGIYDRIYRIGWQDVPPFQQKAPDGSPRGLAIDLVRDAARRRGIRLQWVWYPGSAEQALRSRQVDLWPLFTITPERLTERAVYISKPYLSHDHTLLVLDSSSYSTLQDLASASIAHTDLPITQKLLNSALPKARSVTVPFYKDAIENVCTGRVDAAFVDEFTAGAALLGGISCPARPLRQIPMPMLRTRLGVGSTLEASAVADEIRKGIDASVVDGELAHILMNGGYSSSQNLAYLTRLVNSEDREQWLMVIVVLFASLLGLTIFTADGIRRQRNQIKKTEAALRESEQQLQLVARNLSEMVMLYDMNRRLVFASPSVEQRTGYSISELQQQQFICWIHPDDRSRMLGYWDKFFEGTACYDEEYRLVTKDGATRWHVATWGPIYDENGRQVGVQGSERDITERKLAEQALRESERKFRNLLEGIQLVAIMTDANCLISFCNDYTLKITGWSREEVIGRPASDLLGSNSNHLEDTSSIARADGRMQAFAEGSLLMKDGGRRWIQWSGAPLRDSAGHPAGFASLGEDVTELRALREEAAKRESEQRFRSIADTAPLMIWLAEPDGKCTFVNKGWLDFTGRTLEDELGDGWAGNVHPDDLQQCLTTIRCGFAARRAFHVEYRKKRRDGEYRWVLGGGVPRFGSDGECIGFVGNCNDITELKNSRDEDIARQKLESVGRLAAGIAHDFNNILGIVLAQADLAYSDAGPHEPLNNIRRAAIRGSGIVRQLLIYAGQESAISEPVDISALVSEMMDLLKVAVSKHAEVRTLLGAIPAVRANPAQLRQVIMNLVTNASDAIGEEDGVITIRTSHAGTGELPDFAGECVALEISDTGCGISPELQSKMFEPFFTTKSSGQGLGLAVVQRTVHALAGAIQFYSEPGGTTFRILLPAINEPTRQERSIDLSRLSQELDRQAVILVVEDEAHLRLPVSSMLRKKDFSVLEAADGTEALELIRSHNKAIDLVLLDVTLPGAPSRDVLAEVRRLRPEIKVIVTTAYGQNKVDDSFPGMQIDFFLRKPYRLAELVTLTRSLLYAGAADAAEVFADRAIHS